MYMKKKEKKNFPGKKKVLKYFIYLNLILCPVPHSTFHIF